MRIIIINSIFRNLLFASLFSTLGTVIYFLALISYAGELENSTFAISIITIIRTIPFLFLSFTGAIADKTENKTINIILFGIMQAILFLLIGFVIQIDQSMYILIILLIINFIVSIIGQYKDGLYSHMLITIVDKKNLPEALGLSQGLNSTINIFGSSIGGILLLIMSYEHIAWSTTVLFLISTFIFFLIFAKNKNILVSPNTENHKPKYIDKLVNDSVFKIVYNNFKFIINNKKLRHLIFIFMIINMIFYLILPIFSIVISNNKDSVIYNFSTTISIISFVFFLFSFLGNIIGVNLFKKLSMKTLLLIDIFLIFCVIILFLVITNKVNIFKSHDINYYLINTNNIITYITIIFISLFLFITGSIGPRFSAHILTIVNKDIIASFRGAVTSILTLSIPFGSIIFLSVANLHFIFSLLMFIPIIIIATILIIFIKCDL